MAGPRRRQHDRGQEPVLGPENARRQQLRRVARLDRYALLRQDRSAVVRLIHQMHRRTGLGGAARKDCAAARACAREVEMADPSYYRANASKDAALRPCL